MAAGLLLPSLILLLVAALVLTTAGELRSSYAGITHILGVKDALSQLLATIKEVETAQRGYLLTSRDSYLDHSIRARESIPGLLRRLRDATANNPRQQDLMPKLEARITEKLAFIARTISLQQQGRHDEAITLMLTDQRETIMDEVRDDIAMMMRREDTLLASRREAAENKAALINSLLITLLVLDGIVILIVSFLLIRVRSLKKFVTICAWSRTIKHEGRWISFDEYLRECYGVSISHSISDAELTTIVEKHGSDEQ